MKLVIQCVEKAFVSLYETREQVSSIGKGLVVLWGVDRHDTWREAEYCIRKMLKTRFFSEDLQSPWKKSVVDMDYEILVVSQFTLLGSLNKGTSPDFRMAMLRNDASIMIKRIVETLQKLYKPDKVKTGSFGNRCVVSLENSGPRTFIVESPSAVNSSKSSNKVHQNDGSKAQESVD